MNIREKAHQFAIESLSQQIEMIEKAFLAGYNEAKGIYIEDGIEYVDLGLPSGTLWAKGFCKNTTKGLYYMLTYGDALCYQIPTKEQFDELKQCLFRYIVKNNEEYTFVRGLNGNMLGLKHLSYGSKKIGGFWIKESDGYNSVMLSQVVNTNNCKLAKRFVGNRLPLLLVKQK